VPAGRVMAGARRSEGSPGRTGNNRSGAECRQPGEPGRAKRIGQRIATSLSPLPKLIHDRHGPLVAPGRPVMKQDQLIEPGRSPGSAPRSA